jgi:2-phosphosulfolactate phosphatase
MIHTLLLPPDLPPDASRAQVVILDILRATSTIVTTLSAGAREVRLFDSLDAARQARATRAALKPTGPHLENQQSNPGAPEENQESKIKNHISPVLLAGEQNCLKPPDFDLCNSPREHLAQIVAHAAILLATTNGTRAAAAAQKAGAQILLAGALLNAAATARALIPNLDSRDTLLLCAGTNGQPSLEDTLGAGAILFALLQATYRTDLAFTDTSWIAYHAFAAVRSHLPAALRLGQGGINVINAGLEGDLDHCAQLDALPIVAVIDPATLIVRRMEPGSSRAVPG